MADSDARLWAATKAHAEARGIDLTEWPNQQALVPDEMRWMRAALAAADAAAGDKDGVDA